MTVEIDGANNIVKTNTINEVTSANGITIDGLNIKDSKLVTADSVITTNITDANITSAKINNDLISGKTALASEPADTDEFLVSDAGTLKRIDYSLIKGGGKVGKISMQTGSPNQVDISNANFTQLTDGSTPLVASITPSASSSNVIMQVCIQAKTDDSRGYSVSLRRAGTQFYASADAVDVQYDGGGNHNIGRYSWFAYDTGISTTSATEYSVFVKTASGGTVRFQNGSNQSQIILWEILA